MDAMQIVLLIIPILMGIIMLAIALIFASMIRHWLRCFLAGCQVPFFSIIGMKLRGSSVDLITQAFITFRHRETPVDLAEIESTYLAHKHQIFDLPSLINKVEQSGKAQKAAEK